MEELAKRFVLHVLSKQTKEGSAVSTVNYSDERMGMLTNAISYMLY
jgi:hypothetical protein